LPRTPQAREYLAAGDAANAAKLLDSVAALYWRERWAAPLAATLLEARECASRLGRVRVRQRLLTSSHVMCLVGFRV